MIIPFGCYMRVIERWSIRRVQVMHDGHESLSEQRFELLKNERDTYGTFDITEIREVKELFELWEDPYQMKPKDPPDAPKMKIGDSVRKRSGSQWSGTIVGSYSTYLTPIGWVVQSDHHAGSCQIYPESALELI